MAAVFNSLRKLDAKEAERQASFRLCRRLGAPLRWQALAAHTHYLRFRLERDDGSLVCLVGLDGWVRAQWPDLHGLAWDVCDVATLRRLIAGCVQPIRFEHPGHAYRRAHFEGRVDGGQDAYPFPCVESREGDVWIERADIQPRHAAPLASWVPALAISADYRIGHAHLSVRRLDRLRVHDVLLFELTHGTAYYGERPLFHFTFNTGQIVMDEIILDTEFEQAEGIPVPSQAHIPVASLNVQVDVVLCRMRHTLEQLAELQPGMTWELPENAHRQVRLLVNGQCVATGEVVQVADKLGVQIASLSGVP
ncbi:MAG TPA: FliM/FliN family flagellar motor switch protein [Dyella sp.]|uniref:FliM/FliN family flagellar motor switch protein n=1 Tax=Dyella sp. TaxID=1869338 RepID=UPI002F9236D4